MNTRKMRFLPLFLLTLTSLCSCQGGGINSSSSETSPEVDSSFLETSEDEELIHLEDDKSEQYVFADSSNENGSMNYEIFVRSFYDSDGDGVGDLNGVKEKLPYICDMGFKTIWMMPIFPSPSYHGYDVTNYYSVNPDYGTLDDFDALVIEASKYNIDIMLDMVFNHCSIKNPYFAESFQDYKSNNVSVSSKADWFNWGPGGQHQYQGVSYESRFDAGMPDFNLDSEGVRKEIEAITKFWIGHGVKGFRLDAVLYYYYQNTTKNVEFLTWLKEVATKYDPSFYMVGECWASDPLVNDYYESTCDSFFRFGNATGGDANMINMVKGYGNCENFAVTVEGNEKDIHKRNPNGYSSYFLSNHDQDRVSKNFESNMNVYKAAVSLYTLLPGNSYTYYGEEISLRGVRVTSPKDDGSDVRRRLPMVWSKNDKKGECSFPEKNRQDLNNNKQVELGVNDQLKDGFSLLNHYKMLIHLRNKYSFIKHATFSSRMLAINTEETSVLAYSLKNGSDSIAIVHNFSPKNVEVNAPGSQILDEINVSHKKPALVNGKLRLGAYSSVILK